MLLFRKILQEINAFIDLNFWIIYDSELALRLITLPRLDQQFENLFVLRKPGFTHVRFESHFPFVLYRVEGKYGLIKLILANQPTNLEIE